MLVPNCASLFIYGRSYKRSRPKSKHETTSSKQKLINQETRIIINSIERYAWSNYYIESIQMEFMLFFIVNNAIVGNFIISEFVFKH